MSRKILILQLWPKMLSISQIAVFFHHQYLWTESNNSHGDDHQGKVGFNSTIFGGVLQVMPHI